MPIHMTFAANGHNLNLGKGQILAMACGGTVVTPTNLGLVGSRMAAQPRGPSHRAAGNPGIKSLVFQWEIDPSLPSLTHRLRKKGSWPSLSLNLMREESDGTSAPFATLTMTHAVLAGFFVPHGYLKGVNQISWSGSDGDEACKEEVTFEYGGLQVRYLGGATDLGSWGRSRGRKK